MLNCCPFLCCCLPSSSIQQLVNAEKDLNLSSSDPKLTQVALTTLSKDQDPTVRFRDVTEREVKTEFTSENQLSFHKAKDKAESVIFSSEDKKKIEKCIAIRKGNTSRNLNVTTRQMYTMLSDRFPANYEDLWKISRALAQQVNEISENPARYLGKNLQLKQYFFSWIELSEDGKEIELFIKPPNSRELGSGTAKKASSAFCLQFPLKVEPQPKKLMFSVGPNLLIYQRNAIFTPKVLLEPRSDSENSKEKLENSRKKIETEIKTHKLLSETLPNTDFISPIKKTKPPVQGTIGTPLYSQNQYVTDLCKVFDFWDNPVSSADENFLKKIRVTEILKIIKDVAITLRDIHSVGFTHHDVKPQNIYIKLSDDQKKVTGVLADYDLSQIAGVLPFIPKNFYPYWDTLGNKGLVTPFTDVFALAKTLALSLLPGFEDIALYLLMSKSKQLHFLNEAFKKIFPGYCSPKKFDNFNDLLEWYESIIIDNKPPNQDILINKLRAASKVLELFVEILLIDQNLKKQITINNPPVWNFIREKDTDSQAEIDKCLNFEIEHYFNIKGSVFEQHITSKIPLWEKLDPKEKILQSKKLIKECELDLKEDLDKILLKLTARESALTYVHEIGSEQLESHPLYLVLMQPSLINNESMIDKYLQKELEILLKLFRPLSLRFTQHTERLELNPQAWREELGNFFNRIKNDPKENVILKEMIHDFLQEKYVIEKTMQFALEVRNSYATNVKKVTNMAMTMETFLSRIDAIFQTLIPLEEQEEKKFNP